MTTNNSGAKIVEYKDTGKIGAVVHRHQAGRHSKRCAIWDDNFKGEICKYSWEPHGTTATDRALGYVPSKQEDK